MLLLNKNKNLAAQIATSFCIGKINPTTCIADLKRRLNFFSDNIFVYSFLPFIKNSSFFVFIRRVETLNQDEDKVYLDGFEIITGENKSIVTVVLRSAGGFNNIIRAINEKMRIGSYTSIGKVGKNFIVRLDGVGNSYPQNVRLFGLPVPKPPVKFPVIPVPVPVPAPVPTVPVESSGFNFATIFENPMILIGGSALLFFYLLSD